MADQFQVSLERPAWSELKSSISKMAINHGPVDELILLFQEWKKKKLQSQSS